MFSFDDLSWMLWYKDVIMDLKADWLPGHAACIITWDPMLGLMLRGHWLEISVNFIISSLSLCFVSELWGDVCNVFVYSSSLPCSHLVFNAPWAQNSRGPTMHGIQRDSKQVCYICDWGRWAVGSCGQPGESGLSVPTETCFQYPERTQDILRNLHSQGTLPYPFLFIDVPVPANHLCWKRWHRRKGQDRVTQSSFTFQPFHTQQSAKGRKYC